MFLKEIIIKNYGSLKDIAIKLKKNEDETINPVILVGKNGVGKTLFLTQIIDSLIEFKRTKFQEIKEVNKENYFKIGKKDYICFKENFSYVSLSYGSGEKEYNYTDCMVYDFKKFKENEYLSLESKYLNIDNEKLKESGFFKEVSGSLEDEFNRNIYLYFPVYRYYKPAWLNKENDSEINFNFSTNLIGKNEKNMIKTDILNEIENWILDLVLDKYLYELSTEKVIVQSQNFNFQQGEIPLLTEIVQHKGYFGKNTEMINYLNNILYIIYKVRYPELEYARIGVIKKDYGRKISIYIKEKDKEEFEIAPTFSHLSSGETMILCLFASILREYDSINKSDKLALKEISGIVLIDEIDLTLHIELAKEVLPEIIKLFPKIQFFITTHSPFFLLGMEENFKEKYSVIDLATGCYIENDNFEEIKTAYNIFTKGYTEIKERYEEINKELENITKTLIITEGKTDVLHLKKAISVLKYEDKLNVEFFDFGTDKTEMGEGQLYKLLKELSKIKHHNKIIGIFDRDEGHAKKCAEKEFEDLGNNVYAFAIKNPTFREYHKGISMEQLYEDEDIKRIDENGRRLFLSNEFNETGYIESEDIRYDNSNKLGKSLKKGEEKIIDSGVYKKSKSIALSKMMFASNIFDGKQGFENINFEGFRGTLDLLYKLENFNIK